MTTTPVGMRVAVLAADMKTFLGYGEYLGDFPNPELAEIIAKRAEKSPHGGKDLAAAIRNGDIAVGRNPKMKLDDGTEIWGCECWWGPAEAFVKSGAADRYNAPKDYQK